MNPRKSRSSRELDNRLTTPHLSATPGQPKRPTLPKEARAEWDRVAAVLDSEGRLTVHDGGQLRCHSILFQRLCDASELVNAGLLVQGQRGANDHIKNPAIQIERTYADLYLRSCGSLKVNAGSRDGMTGSEMVENVEGLLD